MKKYRFLILVCFAVVLFLSTFVNIQSNNFSFASELAEDLFLKEYTDLYTDSDYLYDEINNSISSIYTIRDYSENLWGVYKNGDDMITQIVPKVYFRTICDTTVVGKEYGFYVKTVLVENDYKTRVFIFDIVISMNEYGNELKYSVEPLFVYEYKLVENKVLPTTEYKVDLSGEYYLTNISYGFTVLNENNYNSQDSYGYIKEKDDGPVILQTRYNSNGYEGKEWQGKPLESAYILVKRICLALPVVKKYTEPMFDIIDFVSDGKNLADLVLWENTPYTRNNELNIITYKDKTTYKENEPYLRTGVLIASDSVVYKSGEGHYSQGVLLLSGIENAYRIYENIKVNIARVDYVGNVTIISTGDRSEYSVHNNNYRKEIEMDTNELVYTLPYGKKIMRFVPEYTGNYSIYHDVDASFDYYVYPQGKDSQECLVSLNDLLLKKGEVYYIDIVSKNDDVNASTMYISLQSVVKNISVNLQLKAGETIAFAYRTNNNNLLSARSSNAAVKIANVINRYNSSQNMVDVDRQSIDIKLYANNSYVIELVNTTSEEITTSFALVDLEQMPQQIKGDNTTQYYWITSSIDGEYIVSLKYKNANVGVEVIDENLIAIPFSEGFGIDYKNIKFQVSANKKVYIGIYDSGKTNENIKINGSNSKNTYKWKVNGSIISGKTYELRRGYTAYLELIVNDIVIVKSFNIATDDYKFSTKDNAITIDPKCRIQNYFEVKAYMIEKTSIGEITTAECPQGYYESTLWIVPILAPTYTFFTYNDDSGLGFKWKGLDLAKVDCTVSVPGKAAVNMIGTTFDLLAQLKTWAFYSPSNITITINRILVRGTTRNRDVEDWVDNGTRGFSVPNLYINALFYSGTGSSTLPYLITCKRHFENLRYSYNKYYKLNTTIKLSDNWIPFPEFSGTLDGNGNSVNGMTINIETSENVLSNYGLFSINSGTIKNLCLLNVTILASPFHGNPLINVGGLVGTNKGTIDGVTVSGLLNCNRYLSAIAAVAADNRNGVIKNCIADNVTLYGNGNMGGIVGVSYGGKITQCHTKNLNAKLYIVKENRNLGGIAGCVLENGIIEYCYNLNGTLKFDGYSEIAWNQIAPHMGIIVGGMENATLRFVSVTGATLDPGSLPEKDNHNWFLNPWYYPRRYIGAVGNGACGVAVNSTIGSTDWVPN